MSAVWVLTTSGALVRGDTIMWISKAGTSLSVQQQGGESQNTLADRAQNEPDLPPEFGAELAALLTQLSGQRDPHLIRAAADESGWHWQIDRIEYRTPQAGEAA